MNPSQRALPGRMTSVSIVAYRQRIPAGVIAVLLTSLWACSPSETDAVVEGLGSARESVEPGSLPGLSDVMRAKQPPACRGSGACDDDNPCTFNDKCVKGLCLGTAYSCNDRNACTTDICDGTGRCRFVPNTAACDDGNACTTGDACSAGRCSGAPLSCDDGNLCTTDSCDPAVGCVHTANNASCDDGNPCTNDSCDPTVGCVHTANTAP